MSEETRPNRLLKEKSPYLLQHAYNPVDWYPWGKEAFEASRLQNKPIFLSIGYATCHWCHVMEKESFEDVETANILNDAFINIKVDREELPAVDSMYMELAQVLMSSSGGWPLNVILTPDLKPFFAITYMPPKTRRGLMGLQEFTQQIKALWASEEKPLLLSQADHLYEMFEKTAEPETGELPTKHHVHKALEIMLSMADTSYGGFKGEPKFPLSFQASFLLEQGKILSDSRCLVFATHTLDRMQQGGMYDHIGGGFSRYAVDEKWIVPHFEKMLYDNASLAKTYLDAWKLTKNPSYKTTCSEICSYILRDMTHERGGFYSAEDADTDGKEGKFYTWTLSEIEKLLTPENAELFCSLYNVTLQGNFEEENVLYLEKSLVEFAEERDIDLHFIQQSIDKSKKILFNERSKRRRPFIDDKIIVSWNGLMIDALVKAGSAFENKEWILAAVKAATFIKEECQLDGELCRRWRDNEPRFAACLDDYAFMIKACLSLFEEGLGEKWLKWAIELTETTQKKFKNETGAFYFSAEGDDAVPIRKCEFYDGAEPSGNAIHAENLLRLYQITLDDRFLAQAEDILCGAKYHIETYPPGSCYSLRALAKYLDTKAPTLVVALDLGESLKEEIAREIHSSYSPHMQVVWLQEASEPLQKLLPFMAEKRPIDGQTAVYICDMKGCRPPLLKLDDISKAIRDL